MFRGSTRTRRPPRLASLDSSKERNVPHPWDRKVCRAIGSKEALSCENDRQAFNFPFPPLYCFSPWLRFPVNSRSFFNASPFQFFSSFCRRGVAQLGSAPALGAGGRRFKSCRPDHIPHSSDIFCGYKHKLAVWPHYACFWQGTPYACNFQRNHFPLPR